MRPESILSYGVVGLGFLLAFLAYRLLGREQQKSNPNKSILVAIHVFMIFSSVLCVIGLGSEYLHGKPNTEVADLRAKISTLDRQLAEAISQRDVAENKLKLSLQSESQGPRKEDILLADSMEALLNYRTVNAFIEFSDENVKKQASAIRDGISRLRSGELHSHAQR